MEKCWMSSSNVIITHLKKHMPSPDHQKDWGPLVVGGLVWLGSAINDVLQTVGGSAGQFA
jgi:hypothetical protein